MDFVQLREALADFEHARWSDWQEWVHGRCVQNDDGSLTIPAEDVERWNRQIETDYLELSEEEKDSDRKQVDRYLHLIEDFIIDAVQEQAEQLTQTDVSPREQSLRTHNQLLRQRYQGVSVDVEELRKLRTEVERLKAERANLNSYIENRLEPEKERLQEARERLWKQMDEAVEEPELRERFEQLQMESREARVLMNSLLVFFDHVRDENRRLWDLVNAQRVNLATPSPEMGRLGELLLELDRPAPAPPDDEDEWPDWEED
jgi:hypothetical protein